MEGSIKSTYKSYVFLIFPFLVCRRYSIDDSSLVAVPSTPTAKLHHADVEYGSVDLGSIPDISSSSSKAIRLLRSPYVPSEPRIYTIGQKVVAHWINEGITIGSDNIFGSWLPATVSRVHEDGSLDVVRIQCSN